MHSILAYHWKFYHFCQSLMVVHGRNRNHNTSLHWMHSVVHHFCIELSHKNLKYKLKIPDRPVISSIKPKFDYWFLVNLHVLYNFCEPEIVLPVLQIKTKIISWSQLIQNTEIHKELIIKFWLNWRNCGSVLYYFSCKTFSKVHIF